MANPNKKEKKEVETAEKSLNPEPDEMEKIRLFIRKKQLENQILKKLTDDMLTKPDEIGKLK